MKILDLRIFKQIGLVREFKELKFPKKPRQKRTIDSKHKNVTIKKKLEDK